jgi:hypothetical protein
MRPMRSPRYRARCRQAAAGASRLPDLSRFLDASADDTPRPVEPEPRIEHPPIVERHPTWWQVSVLEVPRDGEHIPYAILIAECRTENDGLQVMRRERWRTRLRKWGDRRPAHTSTEPLKPRP